MRKVLVATLILASLLAASQAEDVIYLKPYNASMTMNDWTRGPSVCTKASPCYPTDALTPNILVNTTMIFPGGSYVTYPINLSGATLTVTADLGATEYLDQLGFTVTGNGPSSGFILTGCRFIGSPKIELSSLGYAEISNSTMTSKTLVGIQSSVSSILIDKVQWPLSSASATHVIKLTGVSDVVPFKIRGSLFACASTTTPCWAPIYISSTGDNFRPQITIQDSEFSNLVALTYYDSASNLPVLPVYNFANTTLSFFPADAIAAYESTSSTEGVLATWDSSAPPQLTMSNSSISCATNAACLLTDHSATFIFQRATFTRLAMHTNTDELFIQDSTIVDSAFVVDGVGSAELSNVTFKTTAAASATSVSYAYFITTTAFFGNCSFIDEGSVPSSYDYPNLLLSGTTMLATSQGDFAGSPNVTVSRLAVTEGMIVTGTLQINANIKAYTLSTSGVAFDYDLDQISGYDISMTFAASAAGNGGGLRINDKFSSQNVVLISLPRLHYHITSLYLSAYVTTASGPWLGAALPPVSFSWDKGAFDPSSGQQYTFLRADSDSAPLGNTLPAWASYLSDSGYSFELLWGDALQGTPDDVAVPEVTSTPTDTPTFTVEPLTSTDVPVEVLEPPPMDEPTPVYVYEPPPMDEPTPIYVYEPPPMDDPPPVYVYEPPPMDEPTPIYEPPPIDPVDPVPIYTPPEFEAVASPNGAVAFDGPQLSTRRSHPRKERRHTPGHYDLSYVATKTTPPASPSTPTSSTSPPATLSPSTPPSNTPKPKSCSGQPPTPAFTCVAGTWVSNSSVTVTSNSTVIIFSSPTVVNGNFSAPSVSFSGLTSTLEVTGCATVPNQVTVTLSPEEHTTLQKTKTQSTTLITSSCSTNFSGASVPINVQTQGKRRSCEKLSGQLNPNGSNMVGVFQIDSGKCNNWWIILVCVICVVILIVVILVLVFAFVPAARECIRPFIKRNKHPVSRASV